MYRNILIPTDGSELSQKAVAKGVELAKALAAKVTAYFAAPPATPIVYRNHFPVGYATPDEHQRMIEAATAKVLGFVDVTAKAAGVPCETLHTTSDFPEDEICKIAERHNCDLIVMGTHGQGGLRGALIGSVTQKVLNLAKVPVLVIR
jgi:nucleotide-binding universal stress UspA family protein